MSMRGEWSYASGGGRRRNASSQRLFYSQPESSGQSSWGSTAKEMTRHFVEGNRLGSNHAENCQRQELRRLEWVPEYPAPRRRGEVALNVAHQSHDLDPPLTENNDHDNLVRADNEDNFSSSKNCNAFEEYRTADSWLSSETTTSASLGVGRKASHPRHCDSGPDKNSTVGEHCNLSHEPDMSRFGAKSGGLKGATWDYDADLPIQNKPIDLFPPHPDLKRPAPPNARERRQIKYYRTLQEKIHRGPLYTRPTKRGADAPAKTFGEDQINRQYGTNRKADMNPFNGVETYSQRMAGKTNEIPKLSSQNFDLNLFPKELWSTLQGKEGEEVKKNINRAMERKARMLAGGSGKDAEQRTKALLEKLHSLGGDEDGEEQDEEANDDEEVDSNFDDESMAGDYDGEQYFDNGEEGSEAGDGGGDDDNY